MHEAMQMSFDLLPACLESLSWSREHQLLMGRQGAVERLAAFLCEMSDRSGGFKRFELQMPRIDVADYLGLTVETVSRAVTRLRSANIIRLHGKRGIEILNREALMGLCS